MMSNLAALAAARYVVAMIRKMEMVFVIAIVEFDYVMLMKHWKSVGFIYSL